MATAFRLELVASEGVAIAPALPGKLWFSALELAAAGLPGIPRAKRKVNELADRMGWHSRTGADGVALCRARAGRGGGLEYHLDVLPPIARAKLLAALAPDAANDEGRTCEIAHFRNSPSPSLSSQGERGRDDWAWFDAQSDAAKAEARRRLAIVDAVAAAQTSGATRSAAVASVAGGHSVSSATLWNWLAEIKGVALADRLPRLAPRRSGGGREAEVNPDAWQLLVSDYLRPSKPTFAACVRRVTRDFCASRGIDLPCQQTLWRKFVREVDPLVAVKRRDGREAHARTMPPQIRSVADLHALELVNIDGHRFDIFVEWPGLKTPIRPTLIAIQDVFSRRLLGYRVDESENAVTTRLAFHDVFRDHGIPKACLLDNGRAFAAKWITGGAKTRYRFKIRPEEPTGLLPSLSINPQWATPYHGQAKPIERMFREFAKEFATDPEFAGAYTGSGPEQKPWDYGRKAVPHAVFTARLARFVTEWNSRAGRRTEMGAGVRSFDEVYAASAAVSTIGKASAAQLRLALLAAQDRVRAHREHGAITVLGNAFWCEALSAHAGEQVTVRFDPDDLQSEIHVYALDGKFIATAPVIAATGFRDVTAAKTLAKRKSEWRKKTKAAESALELLDASAIAAAYQRDMPEALPAPEPAAIRPVRMRGNLAVKAVPETALSGLEEPSKNTVSDRLAAFANHQLRVVE